MSTSRSEHLSFGYSSQPTAQGRSTSPATSHSPNEPTSGSSLRSPFGLSTGGLGSAKMANPTRSGSGSPSHEMGGSSRLFAKRYVPSPPAPPSQTACTKSDNLVKGPGKFRPKKAYRACRSTPGAAPPPAATRHLSVRISPSRRPMASPTLCSPRLHRMLQPYRRDDVLVPALYPPGSRQGVLVVPVFSIMPRLSGLSRPGPRLPRHHTNHRLRGWRALARAAAQLSSLVCAQVRCLSAAHSCTSLVPVRHLDHLSSAMHGAPAVSPASGARPSRASLALARMTTLALQRNRPSLGMGVRKAMSI